MKKAKDYLTIELEYDRPRFRFPDLSSPDGNPLQYFNLAIAELKKNGFSKEAKELDSFKYPKYEDSFNLISRFLDFTEDETVLKEDDDYIYYKVPKDKTTTKQLDIFKIKSYDSLLDLMEEGHDFSITNCYNRNHLYYLNDLDAIKFLVEENKKNNWFELFSLDAFNSTLLHGNRSIEVFSYLLNEMAKENVELANRFLFGTNSLGNNSFGEALSKLDDLIIDNFDFSNTTSSKKWCSLKEFVKVLGIVSPTKRDEIINLLDNLDKAPYNIREKIGTMISAEILAEDLNGYKSTVPARKIKI